MELGQPEVVGGCKGLTTNPCVAEVYRRRSHLLFQLTENVNSLGDPWSKWELTNLVTLKDVCSSGPVKVRIIKTSQYLSWVTHKVSMDLTCIKRSIYEVLVKQTGKNLVVVGELATYSTRIGDLIGKCFGILQAWRCCLGRSYRR